MKAAAKILWLEGTSYCATNGAPASVDHSVFAADLLAFHAEWSMAYQTTGTSGFIQ